MNDESHYPHVTIIILNWNTCQRVARCLQSLQQQTWQNFTIIVVDNGSDDDSATYIAEHFPHIHLIALPENIGYAGGVNYALPVALAQQSEYIVLLNSDTLVPNDFVASAVSAMEQQPEVGIATPKIRYTDEPDMLWGIGGAMLPAWLIVYGMHEQDSGQYDHISLDFVFGCAMIIRRVVLERIGGLDERFFVYYEDVDLCLRSKQAGYGIGFFPHITVWHDGSHSTQDITYLREFYYIRSRMILFHKHVQGWRLWQFFARETLYVAGIVRTYLMKGDLKTIAWYFKGLVQGIAFGRLLTTTPKK